MLIAQPLLDDAVGQFDRGVEIFGILKLRPVEQQFRPLLERRQIAPRKIIDVTRRAKRSEIPPDISIVSCLDRGLDFRDECAWHALQIILYLK